MVLVLLTLEVLGQAQVASMVEALTEVMVQPTGEPVVMQAHG